MAAIQEPNLGLNYAWALGESGWNTGMDDNLKKLGATMFLAVESATTTTPPSIVNGERYIIPAGATAAWSGRSTEVAVAIGGAWAYYVPSEGWSAKVKDDSYNEVYFNGSAWNTVFTGASTMIPIDNTDSPYSATWGEDIEADCSAGNITINLPTAVGKSGRSIIVTRIDDSAFTLTVDGYTTETINGSLTDTLNNQWTSITFKSNGTNVGKR